jgi:cyclohexanone monooxygenase
MTTPSGNCQINIDVEALKEKYREERDRRLVSAGTNQYYSAEGKFAHFNEDPHAGSMRERDRIVKDVDVVIIGTGFGGMEMAATLSKSGLEDFLMIDRASDFGGTWYWNRYPGIRCDVESYIYLPYLEETGFMPSERYVRGAEIFGYCQLLGHHFDLYRRALFQTKVTGLNWNESTRRWIVSTSRDDQIHARFVTTQSGIFDRPQLPGISGIEDFEGRMFHSARWDYDYTGGKVDQVMSKLIDKRVGVIGTGATGLQIIPELARDARELFVFQRTDWYASLPKGWQQARMESFNQLLNLEDVPCDIDDGWTRFHRRLLAAMEAIPAKSRTPEKLESAKELADFEYNEIVRARVDQYIEDPHKRGLLKAYYRTMCKRPGFGDDFLPAMNRNNVHLIDASGGIDRITARGVAINEDEFKLDCIILATGFEIGTTWGHRAGYEIVGHEGINASGKFAEGMRTYHGLFSYGFPNLFFMGLTQGGTTTNVPHMLQEQADQITYLVTRALSDGFTRIEALESAEKSWQTEIAEVNERRRPFQESCTPGYFNAEGKVGDDARSAITSGSYKPSTSFFRMWQDWRDLGDLMGLNVS